MYKRTIYWNYSDTSSSKSSSPFLGHAILITCYLINQMSSFVLHDQVHHFILSPQYLLYSLPPCILVHVLYITSHLVEIKFFLSYSNVFLSDVIVLKKDIVVSLLIFICILCQLMSLSLSMLHIIQLFILLMTYVATFPPQYIFLHHH